MLAAGTVCFMVLVAEPIARTMTAPRPADLPGFCERLIIVVFIALALAIVSGGFWLVLLAADIHGVPIIEACLHGGVMSVITDIRFGQVAIARLALALLIAALLPWPATRLAQLAAAIGLIALPALTGHAGATPGLTGRIHLVSDMVHLLAAGAWLGGLPAFAMLLAQARRSGKPAWHAFASSATARFSLIGIVAVGVLLATGLINSWNLLAGPRDLISTEYGRLVLLKISLFAAMVAVAAVNRYHLSPQLPAPVAMRALGRNSLAETGLGLCVLVFAAALGTMVPAGHVHAPPADILPDATFVHIHTNEAMADVTIVPARPGPVRVSIRLTREDSSVFAAAEVLVVLTARAQPGAPPISRAATRLSDGNWQADGLEIGQSGIWIVKLIVTPGNGEAIVLDAPIVIDP